MRRRCDDRVEYRVIDAAGSERRRKKIENLQGSRPRGDDFETCTLGMSAGIDQDIDLVAPDLLCRVRGIERAKVAELVRVAPNPISYRAPVIRGQRVRVKIEPASVRELEERQQQQGVHVLAETGRQNADPQPALGARRIAPRQRRDSAFDVRRHAPRDGMPFADVERQMKGCERERAVQRCCRIVGRASELRDIAFPVPPIAITLCNVASPEKDASRIEGGRRVRIRRELMAEPFNESAIGRARRVEGGFGLVELSEGGKREPTLQCREGMGRQPVEDPIELAQRAFIVAGREQRFAVDRVRARPIAVACKEFPGLLERALALRTAYLREGVLIDLLGVFG